MSEIKLSPEMEKLIGPIDGDKTLVDENGNVKGVIITPMMHTMFKAWLDEPLAAIAGDDDENEEEGYTTAEAIAWLEAKFPGFKGGA